MVPNLELKQKVHAHYCQLVEDRIDAFRDMITALTDDARNDAKGSAGDKHETALSMMHIEQEKLTYKLREFLDQKAVLDKLDPTISSVTIILGSLVKANETLLYVSLPLPKIQILGQTILALSPKAPLGEILMGKQAGDCFELNGTSYTISTIT